MILALVATGLARFGLATAVPDTTSWDEFLHSWHEFYLMAGTAAVTLAGLLFVSLSFNMEHLLHDSRAHLLHFARNTMLVYTSVLTLSLMMLVPHLSVRVLGVQLFVVGGLLTVFSAIATARFVRQPDPVFSVRHRYRRGLAPVVGGLLVMVCAWSLTHDDPAALYFLISGVCMLLASAVWSSWDLLVGVARARHATPPHSDH